MILFNGQLRDTLPISDRGLQYGDGVWETIRIKNHQAMLLEQHLERLQLGVKTLALQNFDINALRQEIKTLQSQQKEAVLKIIISRGSGGRGYNPIGINTPASRIVSLHPLPDYPKSYYQEGIQLTLCRTRLAHNPILAGFKHLNCLNYIMARAEFSEPYQEGLVRDYQGHIIEGTMSNVFIIKDNTLYTPQLDACGIKGVMQNSLIKQLATLPQTEIKLVWKANISVSDIQQADAVFITNSIIGIWAVKSFSVIDAHLKSVDYAPHPLIQQLQNTVERYI